MTSVAASPTTVYPRPRSARAMVVLPAPGAPVSTNLSVTMYSWLGRLGCMAKVAIVGPGGVGGLVGALLTRAGHDVVYVARPETAARLNAGGIEVHSVRFGNFT